MKRPTVYLDTNIFSTLFYDGGIVTGLAQKVAIQEWWRYERPHFSIYTSAVAEAELKRGHFHGQRHALAACRRSTFLCITGAMVALARELIEQQIVPEPQNDDALHLAAACVGGMDYLMTWNHSHLANPNTLRKLLSYIKKVDYTYPLLVDPFTIPKASFGQEIKRHEK
jgi:predicted nucleic acid-binding protein